MIVKVFKNLSPCVSREATCFLHATLIPTEECVNQMGGDTWLYYLGQCAKECCDLPGTWDCENDIQKAESDYV